MSLYAENVLSMSTDVMGAKVYALRMLGSSDTVDIALPSISA